MIPVMSITAWAHHAPWVEQRQIEQDLVISRAIVELFSDPYLCEELRFRGGTALNKLHFPQPLRYSEDIDLVRMTEGPIGPVLNKVREVLAWLGEAGFEQSPVAPKLLFQADAEDGGAPIRLKLEINTRERLLFDGPHNFTYAVDNPWYSGRAEVPTYTPEEMLATKLRALLQRDKGRDLLDLSHAMDVLNGLDPERLVVIFLSYLEQSGQAISRAQAEERMFGKLVNPGFVADIRPLLSAEKAERLTEKFIKDVFVDVFAGLIVRLPGKPWARSEEMAGRFDIELPTAAV